MRVGGQPLADGSGGAAGIEAGDDLRVVGIRPRRRGFQLGRVSVEAKAARRHGDFRRDPTTGRGGAAGDVARREAAVSLLRRNVWFGVTGQLDVRGPARYR